MSVDGSQWQIDTTNRKLRKITDKWVDRVRSSNIQKDEVWGPYKTFKQLTTNTWVAHTWKYMWENNCAINETMSNMTLDRKNDVFIM